MKVSLIATTIRTPIEVCIVPESQTGIKGLHQVPLLLQKGNELSANATYTGYVIEDMLIDLGID